MVAARYLVVNGDDFGLSSGVNRGIAEAHERGILTSTSLMVRGPARVEATRYASSRRSLGVGLHIDLCEWIFGEDGWSLRYQIVPLDDFRAVEAEIWRQVNEFRKLMGRDPDHLDSHQHVHRQSGLRELAFEVSRTLAIPLRQVTDGIRFRGEFYGQDEHGRTYPELISSDALIAMLGSIESGATELACHPGYGDDLDSAYRAERAREVASLCDPRVRTVIEESSIQLCRFGELPPDPRWKQS